MFGRSYDVLLALPFFNDTGVILFCIVIDAVGKPIFLITRHRDLQSDGRHPMCRRKVLVKKDML